MGWTPQPRQGVIGAVLLGLPGKPSQEGTKRPARPFSARKAMHYTNVFVYRGVGGCGEGGCGPSCFKPMRHRCSGHRSTGKVPSLRGQCMSGIGSGTALYCQTKLRGSFLHKSTMRGSFAGGICSSGSHTFAAFVPSAGQWLGHPRRISYATRLFHSRVGGAGPP